MSSKIRALNQSIQLLKHSDIPAIHKLHAVILLIQTKKLLLDGKLPDELWSEGLYEVLCDITKICNLGYEVDVMSNLMDRLGCIIDELSAFEPLGNSQCQR